MTGPGRCFGAGTGAMGIAHGAQDYSSSSSSSNSSSNRDGTAAVPGVGFNNTVREIYLQGNGLTQASARALGKLVASNRAGLRYDLGLEGGRGRGVDGDSLGGAGVDFGPSSSSSWAPQAVQLEMDIFGRAIYDTQ
jgi:hypothetical protein